MSYTRLSFENSTPQTRRFFVVGRKLPRERVDSLVFEAWDHFELGPGDSTITSYSPDVFQLRARSLDPDLPNQAVQEEGVSRGDIVTFRVQGTEPVVSSSSSNEPGLVGANETSGTAVFGLYNNFGLLEEVKLPSRNKALFTPPEKLYFYVSVAVTGEQQLVVFEPQVGEAKISGAEMKIQYLQSGSDFEWRISS